PLRVLPFVGAAAAAILVFFFLRPDPPQLVPAIHPAPVTASVAAVADVKPALPRSAHIRQVRVRHSAASRHSLQANLLPAEPAVEAVIRGDALSAPGGIPQGVGLVADLSIAQDGTAQRLHLEPQLIGFERSR